MSMAVFDVIFGVLRLSCLRICYKHFLECAVEEFAELFHSQKWAKTKWSKIFEYVISEVLERKSTL